MSYDGNHKSSFLIGAEDSFLCRCLEYLDGVATATESHDLELELAESQEKRIAFKDLCCLRIALHDVGVIGEEEKKSSHAAALAMAGKLEEYQESGLPQVFSLRKKGILLPIAATIFLLVAGALFFRSTSAARLVATVDAVWDSSSDLKDGDAIGKGELILAQGHALLEFASGAEVVLEGPCQVSEASSNSITISSGQLAASCESESSHGFTVTTPNAKIRDLGTEFGVSVDEKQSELRVFDGAVELNSLAAPETRDVVRAGGFRRVTKDGEVLEEPTGHSNRYVRRRDFKLWNLSSHGLLKLTELELLAGEQSDEDILLWFDARSQQLTNLAPKRGVVFEPMQTEITRIAEGRLPKWRSYSITHPDHAIPLEIDGEYQCLTLAAWVNFFPEGSGDQRRGILMADAWDQPGEIHWQIKGNDLRISVRLEGDIDDPHVLLAARTPKLLERGWKCITTTIDLERQIASHYVDGDLIKTLRIKQSIPSLCIGKCTLGGWKSNPWKEEDRSLNGAIDQVLVWKRFLTAEEVQQLYESSR